MYRVPDGGYPVFPAFLFEVVGGTDDYFWKQYHVMGYGEVTCVLNHVRILVTHHSSLKCGKSYGSSLVIAFSRGVKRYTVTQLPSRIT